MNPKCDVCGVVGAEGQVFVSEAVPFCKRKSYCPNCHSRLYQRVYLIIFGSAFVFGVWGLILLLRNPHSESGWIFLNLLLLQIFFVLMIVPHELGHAFAARWVGFKVQRILLGFGKRLFSFRLFGFDAVVNRVPMGGLCLAQPDGMRVPLWKYFVLVAAGPLVNLVLGLGCWLVFARDYSISKTFSSLTSAPSAALFVTANLIVVLENLFPWVVKTPLGDAPSDGMALWQILVERRVPYVPMPKVQGSTMARRLLAVLRWTVALTIAGVGPFVVIGGIWFICSTRSLADRWSLAALGVFTFLGVASLWVARRIALQQTHTVDARQASETLLMQEALAQSSQEHKAFVTETVNKWEVLAASADPVAALAVVEQGLVQLPNEVMFLLLKASSPIIQKEPRVAADIFERVLREFKWTPVSRCTVLCFRICLLIDAGEYSLAKSLMEECLALDIPPEFKVRALDNVATHVLSTDAKALWEEALRWTDRAIQLEPEKLTLKGTKGSLLVEQGKEQEAEPLLREVCAGSRDNVDQGISSLFLALVAKRRGHLAKAHALAAQAVRLYPRAWILSRIAQEFPDVPKSTGKE